MDPQLVSILSKRKAESVNPKARPSKPKDRWSPSEDQLLRGVVHKHLVEKEDRELKVDNWSRVADETPRRSAKQF